MKENRHRQISTITNLRAQYEAVQDALVTVGVELSTRIEEVNFVSETLNQKRAELKAVQEQKQSLVTEMDKRSARLTEREREVASREMDAFARSEEAEEEVGRAVKQARLLVDEANRQVTDIAKLRALKQNELDSLGEELTALTQKRDGILFAISRERKNLQDITDEYNETARAYDRLIDTSASEADEVLKQLDSAMETLDKVRNESGRRLETVEEREVAVTTRERDAEVLVHRLKKLYAQYYPNIELKI